MLNNHTSVVFWFSGGKDSLACLYLIRDKLPEITVLWANTGKYYPEALAVIEQAKSICPKWLEIKTDRDGQWQANGLPSDIVPIDSTVLGQSISSKKRVTIQSYLGCHWENISAPLWQASKDLGATLIIRGQRADETHRSTASNGDAQEGIQFWHPIEKWTKQEVLDYLQAAIGELPPHFALDHSSMDCYDCTAFAAHSHDRAAYTRKHHPVLYADYQAKLKDVYAAICDPVEHYAQLLKE